MKRSTIGGISLVGLLICFEAAPLVLGFLLGKMLDEYFQRSMQMSGGDFSVFVKRPISLGLLLAALVLVASVLAPSMRKRRETIFAEE